MKKLKVANLLFKIASKSNLMFPSLEIFTKESIELVCADAFLVFARLMSSIGHLLLFVDVNFEIYYPFLNWN